MFSLPQTHLSGVNFLNHESVALYPEAFQPPVAKDEAWVLYNVTS